MGISEKLDLRPGTFVGTETQDPRSILVVEPRTQHLDPKGGTQDPVDL